ncbi:MAG: phosphatidylglycerophosphatase A [Flavitalea sp.]
MKPAGIICSCLGIGYLKGGGTYTAIIVALAWYFSQAKAANIPGQLLVTVSLLLIGIFAASAVEKDWGKDNYKVVIDEAAGMMITLFLIPVDWKYALTGLALFRFFDIVKPLGIKKAERLPGGWGVMADDALAGIYAHVVLWFLIVAVKLF